MASAERRIQQTLTEEHNSIRYNDTGHSHASLFGEYLVGVKKVVVEDPYIRANHQLQNFVRLCELLVQQSTLREIHLFTGSDDPIQKGEVAGKLSELGESLKDADITLKVDFSDTLHDRAIRLDNDWVVKIGRGLDFYQKPQSWFELGPTIWRSGGAWRPRWISSGKRPRTPDWAESFRRNHQHRWPDPGWWVSSLRSSPNPTRERRLEHPGSRRCYSPAPFDGLPRIFRSTYAMGNIGHRFG